MIFKTGDKVRVTYGGQEYEGYVFGAVGLVTVKLPVEEGHLYGRMVTFPPERVEMVEPNPAWPMEIREE